jgi:hypothetical protein
VLAVVFSEKAKFCTTVHVRIWVVLFICPQLFKVVGSCKKGIRSFSPFSVSSMAPPHSEHQAYTCRSDTTMSEVDVDEPSESSFVGNRNTTYNRQMSFSKNFHRRWQSVSDYVAELGGSKSRVIEKVLIANNGVAAVKAIRSIRRWAYEVFGNERAISFVVMATPEDLRYVIIPHWRATALTILIRTMAKGSHSHAVFFFTQRERRIHPHGRCHCGRSRWFQQSQLR